MLDSDAPLRRGPTGAVLRARLSGHTRRVAAVAFAPDGAVLASGGDKKTRLSDMATGRHIMTLTGRTGDVYAVAFSPDGAILASGSGDTTVRLSDVATGRQTATLTGHTDWVYSVAFSPGRCQPGQRRPLCQTRLRHGDQGNLCSE